MSALKNWINTSFAKSFLKRGLAALKRVCIFFLHTNVLPGQEDTSETPSTAANANNFSTGKFLNYEAEVIESNKFKLTPKNCILPPIFYPQFFIPKKTFSYPQKEFFDFFYSQILDF